MQRKIELLAPAGEWDAFIAAVRAGADAVYLAGHRFGARQNANNFDREELKAAVRYAHLFRVRIYVTVNTLVDDAEFAALHDYLAELQEAQVDAVIVQDMGVLRFIRQHFPGLAIHASTQMCIASAEAVRLLADEYGVERVVLARECTLAEIKEITATGVDIEVFGHGALCVSYSGQCLMSSMIGGRSGNRGCCAQPCRLPYTLVDRKGTNLLDDATAGQYLLSPRDLKTIELLPELQRAGVASLKIEGRMKRPEYVATVVDVYRRALDRLAAGGEYQVPEADLDSLRQIFNRDFTTAYLPGKKPGREMMSDRRPNNRGRLIGRVAAINQAARLVTIRLEAELAEGDGIEFWVKIGGRTGVTVNNLTVDGTNVTVAYPGQEVSFFANELAGVRIHDRVFCTLDRRLMDKARAFFAEDSEAWRIPVTAQVVGKLGEPLHIQFFDAEGNSGAAATGFRAETARSQPLSAVRVRQQLERLGQTVFCLREADIQLDEGIMVPVSEINEARRVAMQRLETARLTAFASTKQHRPRKAAIKAVAGETAGVRASRARRASLQVQVDTVEKAELACRQGADSLVFGGDHFSRQPVTPDTLAAVAALAQRWNIPVHLATPRMIMQSMEKTVVQEMVAAGQTGFTGIYLSGVTALALAQGHTKLPLSADWTFNAFNSQTIALLAAAGVTSVCLSPELTLEQINVLSKNATLPLECLVHGRLPLMISAYCAAGSFVGTLHNGDCRQACQTPMYLQDRKDERFPLATDQYCRMHVLNGKILSLTGNLGRLTDVGVSTVRIDGRAMTLDELSASVRAYRQELLGGTPQLDRAGSTRGHFFRGVVSRPE